MIIFATMEMLYHYMWKERLYDPPLRLCDGRAIEVVHPGMHNGASGPDFSAGRIRLEGTEWIGNIEVHTKASDWYRHGHQKDPAYSNVMLHVVAVDDTRVLMEDGRELPQVVLNAAPELYDVYARLSMNIDGIRCIENLKEIPQLTATDWFETLAMERLHQKAQRLKDLCNQYNGDRSQAIFITLSRALGFGLNGLPFEMMSKSLPLKYLFRHSNNLQQIEALLFGQGGYLDSSCNIFDDYYQYLCREYFFLAQKYGLKPLRAGLWKSTTRPANSPQRRIAILAGGLSTGLSLSDMLLDARGDISELEKIFGWEAGPYWREHTIFGREGILPVRLAIGSIRSLMINVAAPFYAAYASERGEPEWMERAIDLLMGLPAEENSKTRGWKAGGIKAEDALRSQALIHLQDIYCDRNRCLECRFGNKYMRDATKRSAAIDKPLRKRKRAVVAEDSWKGCMSAAEATEAAACGLEEKGFEVARCPMADGGEGTSEILGFAKGAGKICIATEDPLGRSIEACYYFSKESRTAYIDIATACGLTRLSKEERNPMNTSSYGFGLMIKDAESRGAQTIVTGLGGSATNDGGIGALKAMGSDILDEYGEQIERPTGADLAGISHIGEIRLRSRLLLLVDVASPLTGAKGATKMFGPQKGANPAQTEELERSMQHLKAISGKTEQPGDGAAGGCGWGLRNFAHAEIQSGVDYVIKAIGLDEAIRGAEIVVTGEGKADRQTLMGKVAAGVLRTSQRYHTRTILTAGKVEDATELKRAGFSEIIDINAIYTERPGIDVMAKETAWNRLRAAVKIPLRK